MSRHNLKAWVRFDGNNTAVAGSLIFQKDKPKVGKWKEYQDVNLCCPQTNCTPDYGQWKLVTGGEAGDGVVIVDDLQAQDFTFVGPDDGVSNGWVYLTRYYAEQTCLTINYNWTSFDEGIDVDRPVYWTSATQPTGIPGDTSSKVESTPESGTWNITVPAGQWFSLGIYSTDSCCGRGFLSVEINANPCTGWSFSGGSELAFPTSPAGYTLYEGGWTAYDDGNATDPVPYAGTFYTDNVGDTEFYLSTNGYIYGVINSLNIYGNSQDLFLTPGAPLNNGDTQNFWYKNDSYPTKWKTSILVYCGHCCGSPQEQIPYSYIINLYQDENAQYIETRVQAYDGGNAGPNTFDVQPSNVLSQVWSSTNNGVSWNYLGFGTVI